MAKQDFCRFEIRNDKDGAMDNVMILFGPHYLIELQRGEDDKVTFSLGVKTQHSNHDESVDLKNNLPPLIRAILIDLKRHGFKADASEVGGDLEGIIDEIRKAHPENAWG